MQLMLEEYIQVKHEECFRLPLQNTAHAWIDLEDIASATVNIAGLIVYILMFFYSNTEMKTLVDLKPDSYHCGKVYYLSGAQKLTCFDISKIISATTIVQIDYISITLPQMNTLLREVLDKPLSSSQEGM
jgi:hypothetical protein